MRRCILPLLLLLLVLPASVLADEGKPTAAPAAAPPSKKGVAIPQPNLRDMTKAWGIQVEALRLTANGSMLDFRYRVTDEKKAAPLFSKEVKPYLLHDKTGLKVYVPAPAKVGSLRSTDPPAKGRVYFMLFANAGKRIAQGDLVTVIVGDFKAEKLKVE